MDPSGGGTAGVVVTGLAAMLRVGGGAGAASGIGVSDGTGAGAGAGVAGVTGAGGTMRWTTSGFEATCAGAARWAAGATTTRTVGRLRRTRGRFSAGAWTMAGRAAAGTRAKPGIWPFPGPAKRRGKAAAPATALASNSPMTTPLVIPIMVSTPDAESIAERGIGRSGRGLE